MFMRLDGSVLQAGTRLFVFLSLAAVILFFNYSLENLKNSTKIE